jgi:hypothetical protein
VILLVDAVSVRRGRRVVLDGVTRSVDAIRGEPRPEAL